MVRRSLVLALVLAVAWLATAVPVLADDGETSGEVSPAWPTALAWLVPIGLGMLACGAVRPERVAAVIRTGWLALGVSVIGYWLAGFAFQFGGVGFVSDHPDLAGLAREWAWAPLEASWGSEWGAIGLEGYLLRGPASTPLALSLFLTQLPWITTAVAVPLWSLQGRTRPVVLFLSGTLQAALYALAGNWIWGGGWLANLGLNLGLGHGYVDAMGAGPVHLAGAATALAGMLAFGVRAFARRSAAGQQLPLPGLPEGASYVPMPPLHLPVLATFGAWLAAIGWLGWSASTPEAAIAGLHLSRAGTWINLWLAAGGGAILALAFSWLVTGEGNALMVARGVLGALIAVGPGLPFYPPWAALAVGAGAGLLVPFVQYTVEHVLRFDDPTSAVATHGVPALWGLLAVGLFAAGQAGAGWNRVGTDAYLGVQGQGVSGYLVAWGYASDWPGQLQAQVFGVVAIGVTAFVLSWLLFAAVQGLSQAWVGEYTLRLPKRHGRQRPRRQRTRPPLRGRRWPLIRIVREEVPATTAGAPEQEVKAPAARGRRLAAVLSPVRRWVRRAATVAVAAARRFPGRGSGEGAVGVEDAGSEGAEDTRPMEAEDTELAGAEDVGPMEAKEVELAGAEDAGPVEAEDTAPTVAKDVGAAGGVSEALVEVGAAEPGADGGIGQAPAGAEDAGPTGAKDAGAGPEGPG